MSPATLFRVPDGKAGQIRIGQARHTPANDLIGYLDQDGYARYDFRTAGQLQALSDPRGADEAALPAADTCTCGSELGLRPPERV